MRNKETVHVGDLAMEQARDPGTPSKAGEAALISRTNVEKGAKAGDG
jgi:hypothetical protein